MRLCHFIFNLSTPTQDFVGVPSLPIDFFDEWLRVASEEAEHFLSKFFYKVWHRRLTDLGSFYGALPVHDGLWQSAFDTRHSLLARLAIVHVRLILYLF